LKDTIKKVKRQVTGWEKLFIRALFSKELVSRIGAQTSTLSKKRTHNTIVKQTNQMTKHFSK
jgi:hypothetical protein